MTIPLQKIDWLIVIHILCEIVSFPKIKRTRLATKCNLNYFQLGRYLKWMVLLNLIKLGTDGKYMIFKITDNGMDIISHIK